VNKLNNKGVTLVELIVSFAIVGVAIIYFFQTLSTVKKIYSDARNETNFYVKKDYDFRLIKAYLDSKADPFVPSLHFPTPFGNGYTSFPVVILVVVGRANVLKSMVVL
jgi:hypothetical protein